MQPRLVGFRLRISENSRGLVNDRCAHLPSCLPGLLATVFDTCHT